MGGIGNGNQGFIGGGTSGGGGTVTSDGVTITGNGSVGTPLVSTSAQPTYNVDLTIATYDLTGVGVYILNADSTNQFVFNTTSIIDGSRVVLINNSDLDALVSGSGCSVLYQGSTLTVTSVASKMIYEFIYSQTLTAWLCFSPTPVPNVDGGNLISASYEINNDGFYYFGGLDPFGVNEITLPNPYALQGLRIVIWNRDDATFITFGGSYIPLEPDETNISSVLPNSISEFISIINKWVMIAQRSA